MVYLDQFNPTGGLTESIEVIYSNVKIRPLEQPIIRPGYELDNNQGIIPPRATFKFFYDYLAPLAP